MNAPRKQRTFDIHLASDVMSRSLEKRLEELGFVKDAFIGGTTGVIHPQHLSNHNAQSIADARCLGPDG